MIILKKHAEPRLPCLFDRMPQIRTKMQHVQTENVLRMRCEICEDCAERVASDALVLSDVSHYNTRAYE